LVGRHGFAIILVVRIDRRLANPQPMPDAEPAQRRSEPERAMFRGTLRQLDGPLVGAIVAPEQDLERVGDRGVQRLPQIALVPGRGLRVLGDISDASELLQHEFDLLAYPVAHRQIYWSIT